jgi:hypothetical protein
MRVVSDGFLDAVRNGGRVVTTCDIIEGGSLVAADLPIVGGEVRMRARSKVRRSCDVTIAGTEWVPRDSRGALAPSGREIVIRRGFVVDGVAELVPMGVFYIVAAHTNGETVRVSGQDRSWMISQQRLTSAVVTARRGAASFVAAWLELVGYSPWANPGPPRPYRIELPDFDIPGLERWAEALEWAEKAAGEALFDGDGVLVLRSPRSFSSEPDYTITDGEGGTLTAIDLRLDRQGVFNHLTLRSSSSITGDIEVVAYDNDPASPTYIYGPYGRVERSETTDMLPELAQLEAVARRVLDAQLGAVGSLEMQAVPNPALEDGDLVRVVRDEIGVDQLHILDDIAFGLTADGTMKCTTRARTAPGWNA